MLPDAGIGGLIPSAAHTNYVVFRGNKLRFHHIIDPGPWTNAETTDGFGFAHPLSFYQPLASSTPSGSTCVKELEKKEAY